MPRIRLLKSNIDALPTPPKETVFWDDTLPGFGLKVTPRGKKVFIVLIEPEAPARPCARTPSACTGA